MKVAALVTVVLLTAASGWGARAAEVAAVPAGPGGPVVLPQTESRELAWDNNQPEWMVSWVTGAKTWVGNDFDVSDLPQYRTVAFVRVFAGPGWPNGRWEGWRLAFYGFENGEPGALIREAVNVKGYTSGYNWNNFVVGWDLPAGTTAFVAALEQVYDHPNDDAFILDGNGVFRGHSWIYDGDEWLHMNTNANPYRNLMLRVVVSPGFAFQPVLAPTSWGRVKGLFK